MLISFEHKGFTFSNYVVNPQANLLIKNGREKRIEAKVMSLLVLLTSSKEEVVTRKQIFTAIWPNVVVGEEGISQLIYSLRNALGDDAKNPQYIETIPKKGYRFIAEVKIIEAKKNASLVPEVITPNSQKNNVLNLNKKWLLASCLLGIVALTITWFTEYVLLKNNQQKLIIESILPITHNTGVEGDFSFYKDHNKMVYVHSTEERVDLYLKTLKTNQLKQFTNDHWVEYSPLWLDENTLIYIRKKAEKYQIIRHKLQQKSEIIYESTYYIDSIAMNSVTPNELTFLENDHYRHNRLNELKSLNLINGKVTYLHDSQLNLPTEIDNPLYALDGKTIYFFDYSDKVTQIVALNLKKNRYKTITKRFTSVAHMSLIEDKYLLISGELYTTKGIWRVDLNDGSITSILPSTGGQNIVRALMKDDQIYYATYSAPLNQKIANINTQTIDQLSKLNSNANEYFSIFSKDNSTIYFVSNRTGYHELWAYDVNKEHAKQVSKIEASFIHRPILSQAEDYLAVIYQKEELTLAIISVTSGEIISKTSIPSMKYPLAWSKNDESLYISEHKGQVNIYEYDRETLQPKLIQKKAGLFAQQSLDSESLTLVDYEFGGVIKLNLITKEITPFNNSIENLINLKPGQLKVVKQSIMTAQSDGPIRKIHKYPLTNNEIGNTKNSGSTLLMTLPNWSRITDFNTDGMKALFTTSPIPQGDIMKIVLSQ
ncbi:MULTISPECIES: winged helix-turn-helix domain-containing protein [unclassified Colwellia]|uniref:winged helix-turn-helix domain-containing protein n=1 Tax=unclassified Colwellia TaxID=196834 RepID=UPI0015F41AC6|nr:MULTISPECIES: winged helix-turn-helix domain-containing protein [unclassified Colwellia]MBA6232472.1 winged helix-turn-helix domain-containing protein [Colwellia sp. MB02u-7]MBA6237691.1 winged helix-turn-helix domain-containing protein [Colwellia sp. MB02u-11]MBA6255366.1 winged helix-turn-helix domain-containing protein [Colwellia sp. MB3u-28]MBA6261506.1 winged helix-turn-helix domain-containing protein [Colwellia sp. MB3u-41]MBA6299540.1 winged helix-turn-helix domain-containing protein